MGFTLLASFQGESVPAEGFSRLERWSADKRVVQSSEGVDDVVVRVHAGVTGEAEDFAFYFGGDWCALGEADLSSVPRGDRSEEHTSELQSRGHLVCRLLLEKKKG